MGQENPNDQPPPPPPTLYEWWAHRIRTLPGGGLLFAVIPLLILGYFGWKNFGAEHLDRTLYALRVENIEVTPQPNWIRGDVRAEVYRNGTLSRLSLLDPQATATIAHAFDAHAWIKRTNRVRKTSGGKVQVDVLYRRPTAMVWFQKAAVLGTQPEPGNKGLCYPVDEEGVVLPGDNFTPDEVPNYFMIFAPNAVPTGESMMAFGDNRILEALKLCRILEPHRSAWKLACIYVEPDAVDRQLTGFNSWMMTVTTQDKRNILWGHAPGKELKDETAIEEKLAILQSWIQNSANSTKAPDLDLRTRPNSNRRLIHTVPVPGR